MGSLDSLLLPQGSLTGTGFAVPGSKTASRKGHQPKGEAEEVLSHKIGWLKAATDLPHLPCVQEALPPPHE